MTNDELDTLIQKVGMRFGHPFARSHLVSFAQLIENATLERAALKCDEAAIEAKRDGDTEWYRGSSYCAGIIREMKK
jgi:hypothetical protein